MAPVNTDLTNQDPNMMDRVDPNAEIKYVPPKGRHDFKSLQSLVCADDPSLPPPVKKFCPTCRPNPRFTVPDWRKLVDQPYLNEKTCEYEVCVTVDIDGGRFYNSLRATKRKLPSNEYLEYGGASFPPPGEERIRMLRKYVQSGVRTIIREANKLESDQIICASYESPLFPTDVSVAEIMESFSTFKEIYSTIKNEPLEDSNNVCPDVYIPLDVAKGFEPGKAIDITAIIEEIRSEMPQVNNPFALEVYAYAKDFTIDPMQRLLKVLVAIPTYVFDAVPDAPTISDIEKEAGQTKESVEIDVKKWYGQNWRFEKAMSAYGKYQSYFHQTQNASLYWVGANNKRRDYYAIGFAAKASAFRNQLMDLGESNGWNFRSNIPSVMLQNARKIRITFEERDDKWHPYSIATIEAQKKGCKYEVLNVPDEFKKTWSNTPTLMNYIAKLNEIDTTLQSSQSVPWLDFLMKYTWPLLEIDYGKYDPENVAQTAGSCVADNLKEFGSDLKDYVLTEILTMAEMMAYEFNSKNCAVLGDRDNQPERTEFKEFYNKETWGKVKKRTFAGQTAKSESKDSSSQEDEEKIESLKADIDKLKLELADAQVSLEYTRVEMTALKIDYEAARESALQEYMSYGGSQTNATPSGATHANLPPAFELMWKPQYNLWLASFETWKAKKAMIMQIKDKISKNQKDIADIESQTGIGGAARRLAREAARKARKDKDHPYYENARKLAMEEWGAQDTLLKSLINFEDFEKEGFSGLKFHKRKKFKLKDILDRMSNCMINSMLTNATKCLLSGTTKERAFDKIVKSTLSAMDVDVLGIFIQSLPTSTQVALRGKIKKMFYDVEIPMPWETGYDPGAMHNTNPYILYLSGQNRDRTEEAEETPPPSSEPDGLYPPTPHPDLGAGDVGDTNMDNLLLGEYDESAGYDPDLDSLTSDAMAAADERSQQYESNRQAAVLDVGWYEDYRDNLGGEVGEEKRMQRPDGTWYWASVEEQQRAKLVEAGITKEDVESYAENATKKQSDGQPKPPGSFGTPLGMIQQMIMEAYVEFIMDQMMVDEILNALEGFPGGALVMQYINTLRCSYQGLFNPPIKSFLSTLTLDACGPDKKLTIGMPEKVAEIFPLPNFFDATIMTRIKVIFLKTLNKIILKVLTMLLIKLLETVDDMLCKGLHGLGKYAKEKLSGNGQASLNDAFAEAFCPNADIGQLEDTQKNLFKASGLDIDGVSDQSFKDLFNTLNSTTSKGEIMELLISKPGAQRTNVTLRISQLVKSLHPEFEDVFGDEDQVADVFSACGNYIPEDVRTAMAQLIDEPQAPLNPNLCQTNEEFCRWNKLKEEMLMYPDGYAPDGSPADPQIDEDTAGEMVDDGNDRIDDEIGAYADIINGGGVDAVLSKAVEDFISTLNDPACSVPGYSVVTEDDELAEEKESTIKDLYRNIERTYQREIITGRNAVLNNILRDKNNFRLKKHQRRAAMPFIFPNYVNSQEDWDFRLANSNKLVTTRMKGPFTKNDGPQGTYPETVGAWMRDEMLITSAEAEYKTTLEKPQLELLFNNSPEDITYEFELKYRAQHKKPAQIYLSGRTTRFLKVGKLEAKRNGWDPEEYKGKDIEYVMKLDVVNSVDANAYENFDYAPYKQDHSYQNVLYWKMLESKVAGSIDTGGKLNKVCDKRNQRLFDMVTKAIVGSVDDEEVPLGFKFGYDPDEAIRFDDLYYVDPDPGATEYTYRNRDKVLGRSKTNNKRVHFLDPAIHGGTYKRPKIYVEPAQYTGWLGTVSLFIPEPWECPDNDQGFLNVTQLANRVKQVENTVPFDERLSLSDSCRVEGPYDKIFAPANHGFMEGTVICTIRVYATEFILRSLPLFGSIAFTEKNVDQTFDNILINEMKKGLIEQDSRWNICQGYTYYLMFLEQAAQTVQRRVRDGLMEETPAMKKAWKEIEKVQAEYDPIRIDLNEILDRNNEEKWDRYHDLVNGSAIIAFGENWERYQSFKSLVSSGAIWNVITHFHNGILTPFKIQLASKMYLIWKAREAAELLLGELIRQELSGTMEKLTNRMKPSPKIYDIQKYLLSKNGIIFGSTLAAGEFSVEKPKVDLETGAEINVPDYGKVVDVVVDVESESPDLTGLTGQDVENGCYYVERYVRVFEKEETRQEQITHARTTNPLISGNGTVSMQTQAVMTDINIPTSPIQATYKPEDKKGQVYNIKEFQDILRGLSPSRKLSDYYGNARIIGGKIQGTIGVKFGVRLVHIPPSSFKYSSPYEELDIRKQERSYQFGGGMPKRAIPVAVFEQDVLDELIGDIDLEDENMGEDLKCYIDKLVQTQDFQVIFGVCFPVRSYVSLYGAYCYYSFFESIAADPSNTEEMDEEYSKFKEKWKGVIFKRTKKKLRRLFNSTYRTDGEAEKENRRSKTELNANFLMNILPNAYFGIDPSVKWWQALRIVNIRPLDADGKPCKNAFQKLFD